MGWLLLQPNRVNAIRLTALLIATNRASALFRRIKILTCWTRKKRCHSCKRWTAKVISICKTPSTAGAVVFTTSGIRAWVPSTPTPAITTTLIRQQLKLPLWENANTPILIGSNIFFLSTLYAATLLHLAVGVKTVQVMLLWAIITTVAGRLPIMWSVSLPTSKILFISTTN